MLIGDQEPTQSTSIQETMWLHRFCKEQDFSTGTCISNGSVLDVPMEHMKSKLIDTQYPELELQVKIQHHSLGVLRKDPVQRRMSGV